MFRKQHICTLMMASTGYYKYAWKKWKQRAEIVTNDANMQILII